MLHHIKLANYTTISGVNQDIELSYQLFGKKLYSAPIILVNHALTGNSNVAGKDGWWSSLIGEGKCIDTNLYTILSFNIPGNGHDSFVIDNYKDFVAGDIAHIFLLGLEELKIERLFTIIGGSLGGGIAWEMAALKPAITEHLVPVASDWKSTDWIIANCLIQEQLLLNSKQPLHDARMHAMLCYRTPESFKKRFKRTVNTELALFNVESWLLHHGGKLQKRFQLSAYKLMNQLLRTITISSNAHTGLEVFENSAIEIHIISVNTDLFFTPEENKETYRQLKKLGVSVSYREIESIHGHDAFLMEFAQLEILLKGVFKNQGDKRLKALKII